jgi:pimeloyl-ACP methyl ester carboxylesterase
MEPAMELHLGDDVTIAYDSTGTGPVVVQAHGLMSSRAVDSRYGLAFPGLAAEHTLVRYDARGHGESTGRTVPDDYLWTTLATDLLRLIEEVAGDDPVDAIGASMGAATILTAAVRRPEAFRRLVLVIPPTAWDSRLAQRAVYLAGADAIEEQGLAAFVEAMSSMPVPPVPAELGVQLTPQVAESLLPSVLRGAAVSDLPGLPALAGLDLPVLLLPWVGDPVHPVGTAEQLAVTLPDARLHVAQTSADLALWRGLVATFLAP